MLTTACIHEKQLNFPSCIVLSALGVPPAALEDLGDDSYLVSTARGVPAGSLTIASSKSSARGTMYGAFALLRALGFEFFAENATEIPDSQNRLLCQRLTKLSAQATRATTCTCWASRNWRVLSPRSNAPFEPTPPRYHWSRADESNFRPGEHCRLRKLI